MKTFTKLALIALSAIPMAASAQNYLYIPTQLDHFDIDGIGGGGPFLGYLQDSNHNNIAAETFFCDSVPQEFYIGQTFAVTIQKLDTVGNTCLDPWVISHASAVASEFDSLNHLTLSTKQINTAIQGVIWNLDGQIAAGNMTSSDSNSASFANYLLNQAHTNGTAVSGYARYSCDANYSDPSNPGHLVFGQSQIAAVPEPSAFLGLGAPLIGLAFRRRNKK